MSHNRDSVKETIRRVWTVAPHVDGLDQTIALLSAAREASLEAADRVEEDGGTIDAMQVGLPVELVDRLVLALESARAYRETLRTVNRRIMLIAYSLSLLGILLGLVSMGLQLLW